MHLSHAATLFGLLATHVDAAYPITPNTGGVNQKTGECPDRLEINGFASSGSPGWDLFVQCLSDLQQRPQTTIDSWYQIAGIHGRPYAAWDNVKRAQGATAGGYCPHSSVLFPTWHRPYIQLLEVSIPLSDPCSKLSTYTCNSKTSGSARRPRPSPTRRPLATTTSRLL